MRPVYFFGILHKTHKSSSNAVRAFAQHFLNGRLSLQLMFEGMLRCTALLSQVLGKDVR